MPIPVSSISMLSVGGDTAKLPFTRIETAPSEVNLIALPTRFVMIWRSRPGSAMRVFGTQGFRSRSSLIPLFSAAGRSSIMTSESNCCRSKGSGKSERRAASILEKSSTSLMMTSNASAELYIVSTNSFCSSSSCVSRSKSDMPTMPFMGVLIS